MDAARIHGRLLLWLTSIVLLLTSSAAQQNSPCPSVLQYQFDGSIMLTVLPPYPLGGKIHLQVQMYTTSKQTVNDGEELVLQEEKIALNKRLITGSRAPIQYKLLFTSRVPAVIKNVILNQRIICQNDNINNNAKKFEVYLDHSFYPTGEPINHPSLRLDLNIECGRPDVQKTFIHRGNPTAPGQWPWHAGLYAQEGSDQQYRCGATLITLNAVVTAAHCVTDVRGWPIDSRVLTVYLGKHRQSLWGGEVQPKEVKAVHLHPQYNSSNYYNDIAILILRTPAHITVFVKPACVWGKEDSSLLDIIGKLGFVIGWGENERGELEDSLKMGQIQVISNAECLSIYSPFKNLSKNRTFCAGFRNGTHNPCLGDSGGGIFFKPNYSEEWLLRGLISTGSSRIVDGRETCDPEQYVVFTDVMQFRDWIFTQVNNYPVNII